MFSVKNLGDMALEGQLKSVARDLAKLNKLAFKKGDPAAEANEAEQAKLGGYLAELKAEAEARLTKRGFKKAPKAEKPAKEDPKN